MDGTVYTEKGKEKTFELAVAHPWSGYVLAVFTIY